MTSIGGVPAIGVPDAVAASPSPPGRSAVGMPPYTGRLLRWSFATGIVPPAVLVLALVTKELLPVHVRPRDHGRDVRKASSTWDRPGSSARLGSTLVPVTWLDVSVEQARLLRSSQELIALVDHE